MRAFALIVLLALLCAGCGTPGAPQPPSLGIPRPVDDLRAVRKGDRVTATWSAPTETTDGELIRKSGIMSLFRGVPTKNGDAVVGPVVAEVPLAPALRDQQTPAPAVIDALETLLQAPRSDFAVYGVLAQSGGKSARSSNEVAVPLVPTPPAPQHLQATVVPAGVSLSWDQATPPLNQTKLTTQYVYKVMRREQGANGSKIVRQADLSNEALKFIDTTMEWQKTYDYWITPVTLWQGAGSKGEVEGDDSPVVTVFVDDKFPPATPAELQAVFSGTVQQLFIDLTWRPSADPDLAGYNVYRRAGNNASVKINSGLVKTSSFRDSDVKPGTTYSYAVSAVDLRANESGKSPEAQETVPPQ